MDPLNLKCPTCGRGKGVACIALAAAPQGRVIWVTARESHTPRIEKARA